MYRIKMINNQLSFYIPVVMILAELVLPGNQYALPCCIVSALAFHFCHFIRESTYRRMHEDYKKLALLDQIYKVRHDLRNAMP